MMIGTLDRRDSSSPTYRPHTTIEQCEASLPLTASVQEDGRGRLTAESSAHAETLVGPLGEVVASQIEENEHWEASEVSFDLMLLSCQTQ